MLGHFGRMAALVLFALALVAVGAGWTAGPSGLAQEEAPTAAADVDADGVANEADNCPETANPDQADAGGNGVGDACDVPPDADGDGAPDGADNCPSVANLDQADADDNGVGDACDAPAPTVAPPPPPTEAPPPPTEAPTPVPTDAPEPTATETPEPTATETPAPLPTSTSVPRPTTTPTPKPTVTPTVTTVPGPLAPPWPPPPGFILITGHGPIDGLSGIWGYLAFPISQEFGHTAFSVAHPAWYAYGADYGLDGLAHPGLDIGMPAGTPLYSPVNGTVAVAGGVNSYTFYGNGQPGVGELLIETDDRNQVILGHMGRIDVTAGQRVERGQFVGLSGGDNGDHLHLETRELLPSGGYRVVDPRQSFLTLAMSETATPPAEPESILAGMGYPELEFQSKDGNLTLPAVVDAGRTLIVYKNEGEETSHAVLLRVPDRVGVDRALADLGPGVIEPPAWLLDAAYPGFVGETPPGATSRAIVDLLPGSYILLAEAAVPFDVIGPTGQPEGTLEAEASPDPAADGTIRLSDEGIELPAVMSPGRRVLAVTNDGDAPHRLLLVRSPELIAPDRAAEVFGGNDLRVPPAGMESASAEILSIGELGWLSPNATAWLEVELQAGHYSVILLDFDPDANLPHTVTGMMEIFTVGEDGTVTSRTPVE